MAFYLLQLPVQSVMTLITRSPLATSNRAPGKSVAWLIAILAVAWLSLRYFEKPLLDYVKTRSRKATR
jgi:peptidoglycan/LPS O-acetylase OafA/YrhL